MVRTAEVEELRKVEAMLAGSPLPLNLKPSGKMIAYHVRGEKMDPPMTRAFDLKRACTEFGARKQQKLRGQAETDVEKLIGEKEYDDVDATDNRILPAVHKIMLDALARGTASATFAAADKAEKSGDKGYVQEHDGGTVRVDGGRRMSLNVLDHLLRYGPGKSGEELIELYQASVEAAASERELNGLAAGPALDRGLEKERLNWQREPERASNGREGGRGGEAGDRHIRPRDCCKKWNAGQPCNGSCNQLHKCNFRVKGDRACAKNHRRGEAHVTKPKGRQEEDASPAEAPAAAPAAEASAPATSTPGSQGRPASAMKEATRQIRLDVLRGGRN